MRDRHVETLKRLIARAGADKPEQRQLAGVAN